MNPCTEVGYGYKTFDLQKMPVHSLRYFHKIVDYCRENKIEMFFGTSAVRLSDFIHENHGDTYECFTELCEKTGVLYYDLNYEKMEYLSCTEADFVDKGAYMIGELANRQTRLLIKI